MLLDEVINGPNVTVGVVRRTDQLAVERRFGFVEPDDFGAVAGHSPVDVIIDGRSEMHSEFLTGNRELIAGEQRSADDTLTVDLRPVGARQVADEQQPVGPDENTVHFGDALVLKHQIALLVLAANNRNITLDGDRCFAINRNQLCQHGLPS